MIKPFGFQTYSMVAGILERNGSVIARVENQYRGKQVRDMVLENVDISNSKLYTDEYKIYSRLGNLAPHQTVNHGKLEYVRGDVHTNTIEGYWALVKRAWYGQHHHYTKRYTPLYIAEASFKFNNRKETSENIFAKLMGAMLCTSS